MSERGDQEYLQDIRESISRINTYTQGMDYSDFIEDLKTQDAVLRNIEVIGEAVKNISSDFKKEHDNVEWRKITGMRDKVIHFYFGVNWKVVWDVVTKKFPELEESLYSMRG